MTPLTWRWRLLTTSGSFSQIALHVPASALPGEHTVSAVDRSTGANAQTPFRVDTRWAQFRKRPSHDGHNLGENVLGPDNVGSLGLLWKYNTTGYYVYSSPAVANGVVYLGSYGPDNSVYALNAGTGALLWKYNTGSNVYSSPAVANGVVYVGSEDGNVYALNAGTGALLGNTPPATSWILRRRWPMGWSTSVRQTTTFMP